MTVTIIIYSFTSRREIPFRFFNYFFLSLWRLVYSKFTEHVLKFMIYFENKNKVLYNNLKSYYIK